MEKMEMNQKGITMIEMMVAVSILGILVVIAIPNFQIWVANQQIRSDVAQLEGDLQVARMTAISRNAPVTVLFDAVTQNQYLIFIDDGQGGPGGVGGNNARDLTLNGTEQVLFFVDNGQGAGGVAGDGIRNGTEPSRILTTGIIFDVTNVAWPVGNGILFNGKGLRGRPVADPLPGPPNVGLLSNQGRRYQVVVTLMGDVNANRM
ncbi:MAG: GspH/FimT family pseudopilin [Candidatus Manganitrophaceae bacterium]